MKTTRTKKSRVSHLISDARFAWAALLVVSLFSMASTIILTFNFSEEIVKYINPAQDVLVREKTGYAWVEIAFSPTERRLFQSEVRAASYPLARILSEIAKTAGFSLRIEGEKIKEIAGVSGTSGSWNIYRYDTRVAEPVGQLVIGANDYYRLKFEPTK